MPTDFKISSRDYLKDHQLKKQKGGNMLGALK